MRYLIGIGAQKAGTSWLADYLEQHDEVWMSPIKELHFFDEKHLPEHFKGLRNKKFDLFKARLNQIDAATYFNKQEIGDRLKMQFDWCNLNGNLENYKAFFESRVRGKNIACEITPSYSMLNGKAFKEMRSLAEDVRLIFLLRNPIDRFWSALRMAEDTGHAKIETDFDKNLKSSPYTLRGDYQRTLQAAMRAFPKESIHIEFYENLFSENAIRKICDFSGIQYKSPDFDKEVNKTKVTTEITKDRRRKIYEKYSNVYTWAQNLFKPNLPPNWEKDIAEFG